MKIITGSKMQATITLLPIEMKTEQSTLNIDRIIEDLNKIIHKRGLVSVSEVKKAKEIKENMIMPIYEDIKALQYRIKELEEKLKMVESNK